MGCWCGGRNRFSVSYAQRIISELLRTVIVSAALQLAAAKIEGDVVLFFGFADQAGNLAGADLGATVVNLLSDFYAKRKELQRSNLCTCNACKRIAELDLKVSVPWEPVLPYRLGGCYELSGMAVIAVHRLLKNSLDLYRYIMVADSAFVNCKPPLHLAASPHAERYDGIGEITSYVYAFENEDLPSTDKSGRLAVHTLKTKDLARTFSGNASTLGMSISLAH